MCIHIYILGEKKYIYCFISVLIMLNNLLIYGIFVSVYTEWSKKNRTRSRPHSYCSEWARSPKFGFCTPQHVQFAILSGIFHMFIFSCNFRPGLKIGIFPKSDEKLCLKTWQHIQIAINYRFGIAKSWKPTWTH